MTTKMTTYFPGNDVPPIVENLDKPPTIERLYDIIDTDMVEMHYVKVDGKNCQIWMDEDARMKDKAPNYSVPVDIRLQLRGFPVGIWVLLEGKGLN